MRKVARFDDHLFEQMKDRHFFDAFMSEPCPKCEVLESQLTMLKAELIEAREFERQTSEDNCKLKAENARYREALVEIVSVIAHNGVSIGMSSRPSVFAVQDIAQSALNAPATGEGCKCGRCLECRTGEGGTK
jgi:hypothetical protein